MVVNGLKPLGINPLIIVGFGGPILYPPHPPSTGTSWRHTQGVSLIGLSWWIPPALGLDVSGSWYVRQKCVSARFVPFFSQATKRGVGTGNGERGPIYHPCWKWYVYLCELLILMVNVGKLQGWFGWFWLIWLILMVKVDKYTRHGWYGGRETGFCWMFVFFGGKG